LFVSDRSSHINHHCNRPGVLLVLVLLLLLLLLLLLG
jgi:hypothetical protein